MNPEYNELAQLVYDIKIGNKTIDEVIAWINVTDRRVEVVEDDEVFTDEELEEFESLDYSGVIQGVDIDEDFI